MMTAQFLVYKGSSRQSKYILLIDPNVNSHREFCRYFDKIL